MENHPKDAETGWDPALYDAQHAFVWERAAEVLALLAPQPGERILDLGCGTGHLTSRIAAAGARVVGLDISPEMIAEARRNYPELEFVAGDGCNFHFEQPFDAVFSNAALHWMRDPDAVARSIAEALVEGGRFVAELGAEGNVERLVEALRRGREAIGFGVERDFNPWYFPTIGEYASLLETQGLEVTYALVFDRPTPLEAGEAGLRNWLRMFAASFWSDLDARKQEELFLVVEQRLRGDLFREGRWHVDYRRLRVVARRAE